jgi:glyoxylase-like metal-dependent hydrolase (beta-lactamase superfamily II)/rhodanese-related sulfurtransferase
MQIKQWEDKNLSHFSYAVFSNCQKSVVLIDPARNPQPYLDFAEEHDAKIIGIIETHPHADFTSSHAELHRLTGAPIYVHSLLGALYEHTSFDEGETISFGKLKLTSLHTPGHSPDSISILLEHDGVQKAVFTGDTLFIGDCGRPDLREAAGHVQLSRQDLAREMHHSLRDKLMALNDDVLVYPAHGAGTLCGKNLSKESVSTIGAEKQTNWSLQDATEEEFVANLLADQPFVPFYFPFDVELNRKGAPDFLQVIPAIKSEKILPQSAISSFDKSTWIIDVRNADAFKNGHLAHSMNLMEHGKFETWLGSIIRPGEAFYLAGEGAAQLNNIIERVAAIGYEEQIKAAFVLETAAVQEAPLDIATFNKQQEQFTIVDVRNATERRQKLPFANSIFIPLPELRQRVAELPVGKPIVVHCAGGYRSAAGASIIKEALNGNSVVYDLGEAVKNY